MAEERDDAGFNPLDADECAEVLVCFAVKEEGPHFPVPPHCAAIVTGMGRRNAVERVREELADWEPRLVLTCGFAGALNPELPVGTVLFEGDPGLLLDAKLESLGARTGSFHCAKRVAVTAAEKEELWRTTGADAVEMESAVIRTLCRERGIPSATLRVISDAAGEDLPLDFNALMTGHDRISYWRLTWQLMKSPHRVPLLMRLQRQTRFAAARLNGVLQKLLPELR